MKLIRLLNLIVLSVAVHLIGVSFFKQFPVLAQSNSEQIELPSGFEERWKGRKSGYDFVYKEINIPPSTEEDAWRILSSHRDKSSSGDFVGDRSPLDDLIEFQDNEVALKIFQKVKSHKGETSALASLCVSYKSYFSLDKLINYCEQFVLKQKNARDSIDTYLGTSSFYLHNIMYSLYLEKGDESKANKMLKMMKLDFQAGYSKEMLSPYLLTLGRITKNDSFYRQGVSNIRDTIKNEVQMDLEKYPTFPFLLLLTGEIAESEKLFKQYVSSKEKEILYGGFGDNYVGVAYYNLPFLGLQKNLVVQNKYEEALLFAEKGKALRLSYSLNDNREINLTVKKIQEIAKSLNTTFVEYSLLEGDEFRDNELLIWVVRPNGKIYFNSVNLDKFELKKLPRSFDTSAMTRGTIFAEPQKISISNLVFIPIVGGTLAILLWFILKKRSIAITVVSLTFIITIFSPSISNKIANGLREDNIKTKSSNNHQVIAFDKLIKSSLFNLRGGKINDASQYLNDKSCKDNQECLYQLYQIFIEPIETFLKPEDKIVFIPQGNIYKVPFNALMNADGHYLIENYTISISPSIQIAKLLDDKIKNKPKYIENVLVVGNPRMPQFKLSYLSLPITPPSLKGTEREAEEIAKLYKVKPLIGKEATEPVIRDKMPSANIIHIATHGFEQTVTGSGQGVLHPSIIVATSDNDVLQTDNDALLTNEETNNDGLLTNDGSLGKSNLMTELAIFSACETGLGITVSEGVLGFANNFIYLGVPSVVVSQWQVPDQSTSELMIEFHKNLISGQDKSKALRQAMLKTMKNNPDPINWAGFILIGATNTNINFSKK
ncbi:CHAT domain-containing protein [Microcystis sp. T1-4]|uniref:CHAT domain-containing protein n=1 Tax=Microcystis sp. T1-4 TaxID=1160279 RepID=UPI00026205A6|nr:CHAT domain-containing protein [Microcystis sp. T1-4]CCI33340.1 membrane hypothetical protein [Microcystis sp. T1-4]